MVATQIRLDLNGKKGPDLWARLGESDTRQIVMHPGYFDPDGNWTPLIIDAENIFAKFRIVKPDNTFVIIDASLYLPSDPSIFVVTLPETATQVAGLGYYDLRIGDGETPDTFLYSAGGRFIIDDDMLTDEMIASVASVNGLIFPDDFLTSADLDDYVTDEELADMDLASKTYVNDAIAAIPSPLHEYSETEKKVGKWIDGSDLYERTYVFDSISASSTFATLMDITGLNIKTISGYASYSGVNADMYLNTLIDGNYNAIVYKDGNLLKYKTWYYGNTLSELVLILQYTKS